MQTIRIEISNDKALTLIEQLEALNLIRIIREKSDQTGKKLSERLAGTISEAKAEKMKKELEEMRKEWDRVI